MNEREQNWQSVVDAWQSSHLSGAAFCREHGLVYHQFQYWQQKLRDSESGDKACGAQTHQLVPVQVAHRANTSEVPLQLQLPNGLVIRDVTLSNIDTVTQLLKQL
ncbi:MAG: IS66 family insertion sequence hypothetical protein [Alteromonas sp.]|nr:IS66 family insertion sequence hypothetical protein [Alteromonas sp.]